MVQVIILSEEIVFHLVNIELKRNTEKHKLFKKVSITHHFLVTLRPNK